MRTFAAQFHDATRSTCCHVADIQNRQRCNAVTIQLSHCQHPETTDDFLHAK